MTVESATYIDDLNATYPAGTDAKSEGDDHIRLIKSTLKATFPAVEGAVTPTHTELNYVDGVTSAIQTQLNAITAATPKNLLDNGQFKVWQRSTSSGSDNTYIGADRWKALTDGVTMEMSRVTGEAGYAMRLRTTTSNKKYAVMQVLENLDAARLQGKTVTLSARLKGSGSNLDDVRLAILAWAGTADDVTDPVSAWEASGANPTWATSWTAENTPADLSITTDWATYSVSAALDTASITNIAVVILNASTTPTTSDYLYIDWVQLEIGAAATTCEDRPVSVDIARCRRYYQKLGTFFVSGYSGAGDTNYWSFMLPQQMRATPAATKVDSSLTNMAAASVNAYSADSVTLYGDATAAGRVAATITSISLTADL